MTWDEWIDVVKLMRANWPHGEIPEISMRKWHADLEDLRADQVAAAVETLYRDGREFPPSGAQIRVRVLELSDATVADWSQGYRLALQLAPGLSWLTYPEKTLAWLLERDPIAAEVVQRFGIEMWGGRHERDEQINRAQFRQMYEAATERVRRRRAYAGIGAADLPQLRHNKPRPLKTVMRELTGGTA